MYTRTIDSRISEAEAKLREARAALPAAAQAFAMDPGNSQAREAYSNCRAGCEAFEVELSMLRDARGLAEEADRSADVIERRRLRVVQAKAVGVAYHANKRLAADADAKLTAFITSLRALVQHQDDAAATLNAYWPLAEFTPEDKARHRERAGIVLDARQQAVLTAIARIAENLTLPGLSIPHHDKIGFSAASTDYAQRVVSFMGEMEERHA